MYKFCIYQFIYLLVFFRFTGSCPKLSKFFTSFVCDHLAKHVEARNLVKLKEDKGCFLYFNDIDRMSLIYCDFKEQVESKNLNGNAKSGKDGLKNTLALSEKDGSMMKVASGKDHKRHTEYLKYEIMNSELRHSLRKNFHAIQKNRRMVMYIHLFRNY